MGLDVTVFRNLKNLDSEYGPGIFALFDPETGECEPHENRPDIYSARRVHRRIGNLATVGFLRNEIGKSLSSGIVLDKILYSGAHAGDRIDLANLAQLRAELASLKESQVPEVLQFVALMEDLVAAAEHERNPLVF